MSCVGTIKGPRDRLRLDGIGALSDADLVALILATGSRRVPASAAAAALLEEFGDLAGLARAGVGVLAERSGLGATRAARLAAAIELGARVRMSCASASAPMRDSACVAAWACPRLGRLEHEELWVLALDGARRLRAARCVAKGGLHGVGVHVRDPLRVALREAASGVVIVHNHPGGDPTPSEDDIIFTHKLAVAAAVVATPLVDHVIVAGDAHASLLGLGLLEPPPAGRAIGGRVAASST